MAGESKGISRRRFVVGTVAGVAVGVAVGAAGGYLGKSAVTSTQTTTLPAVTNTSTQIQTTTVTAQPWLPASWDHTADVVVVGFGGAGGAAAWEACNAGASTIVLEGTSAGGGSTNICGGVVMMGGGTPLQQALGFSDTTQNMYNYFMAAGGFGVDSDLTQTYCNNSLDLYDWLVNKIGVVFNKSYQDRYPAAANPTYGLYMSGDEWQHAASATPVPRGHTTLGIPDSSTHSGSGVFQPLQTAVVNLGAQIFYNTLGQSLVVDPDSGRVLGVSAQQNGATLHFKASRGVIITAGGFAFNPDMLAMYAPEYASVSPLGTPGDDGSGIKMGQEIGADVRNMGWVFAAGPEGTGYSPVIPMAMSVLVSQQGLRYMAEDHYLAWSGKAYVEQYNPSYMICDSNVYALTSSIGLPSVAKADTVHDLATALKTPAGVLEDTIALYNQSAATGADPLYNKDKRFVVPLTTPPFYALPSYGSSCFTHGGLRINTGAQVLDTSATPIPGLYAAGRSSASILAQNYQGSGTSVSSALIFGRIAGKNAAAEKPWS